jgi:hypothetical protein
LQIKDGVVLPDPKPDMLPMVDRDKMIKLVESLMEAGLSCTIEAMPTGDRASPGSYLVMVSLEGLWRDDLSKLAAISVVEGTEAKIKDGYLQIA